MYSSLVRRFKPQGRVVIALLLLLIIGWALQAAARAGLSDLYAFQVSSYTQKWAAADDPSDAAITNKEWLEVSGAIDRLLWLVPEHPDYLQAAGIAYGLYANKGTVATERVDALLALSADFYRQSLSSRPAWPYAWGNLVLLKAGQGQLDAEFYHALERAATLGPWEPEVQMALTEAGLAHWSALNAVAKGIVVATVSRGISRDLNTFQRLATSYQQLDTLCLYLPKNAHQQRFCKA
ncbi:MAG: hypothetical protein V7629_17845 [Motiliproteus sp.]